MYCLDDHAQEHLTRQYNIYILVMSYVVVLCIRAISILEIMHACDGEPSSSLNYLATQDNTKLLFYFLSSSPTFPSFAPENKRWFL